MTSRDQEGVGCKQQTSPNSIELQQASRKLQSPKKRRNTIPISVPGCFEDLGTYLRKGEAVVAVEVVTDGRGRPVHALKSPWESRLSMFSRPCSLSRASSDLPLPEDIEQLSIGKALEEDTSGHCRFFGRFPSVSH